MNWDGSHQSTPKLLPPTVFERTFNNSSTNNTTSSTNDQFSQKYSLTQLVIELDKLKYEMNNLKKENDLLRNKNHDSIEQIDYNRPPNFHHQINISTLEEIIHKQANEIKTLKHELNIEKNINLNYKKDHDFELNKSKNDLEEKKKEIDILNENIKQLKLKYEFCLNEEKAKVNNLMSELNKLNANFELKFQNQNSKNEKIFSLENENQILSNEIKNLKFNLDAINKNNEKLNDYNILEDKYSKKLHENCLLNKEIETIKIRLNSLNEILLLQEAQLEQTSDLTKQQRKQGLISKWRLKVFDLLVKNKSIELLLKQDKSKLNITIKDLTDQLDHQFNQNKIYETLLDDKKTQLFTTLQENNKLNDNLNKIKNENNNLKELNEKNLQKTIDLKKYFDNMMHNYNKIDDCFNLANKKLLSLEQRIEYAKTRLDVVKALQTHKETHYKDELKRLMNISENISSIHSLEINNSINNIEKVSSTQIISSSGNENLILKNELDKVLQERNLLTHKLQNDMNLMNERLNKMKEEYEFMIENLNNKIKNREDDLSKKDAEINKLRNDYLEKDGSLNNLNIKYEKLNEQFDLFKKQFEFDLNKQFKAKEDSFIEKLSKMEFCLNEARREQAKAIVMMRQIERGSIRDKERIEKLNKDSELYYKTNIDRLQMKIISLEKERNLLMNTIKQSGISLNMNEYNVLAAATATLTQQVSYLPPQISQHQQVLMTNKSETEIHKWLEQNENKLPVIEKSNATMTTTSIWLDSKNNKIVSNEDTGTITNTSANNNNNFENLSNATSNSKIHENNEILLQIRRIMGNLELSDIDDDEIDDQESNQNEHAVDDSNLTN